MYTPHDRKTLIRFASTFPVGSKERKAILAGLTKTAAHPADRVRFLKGDPGVQKQTVVVLPHGSKSFPDNKFDGKDWHPQNVLDKAAEKASALVRRDDALGFGLYDGRRYVFTTFVILPQGKGMVQLPGHGGADAKDVKKLVHKYHQKLQRDVNQAVQELDAELAKHDWYAAMSDHPGAWKSAERHMQDVITPLLITVPKDVGMAVWKKHAPTKAQGGTYTDDPYKAFRLASVS